MLDLRPADASDQDFVVTAPKIEALSMLAPDTTRPAAAGAAPDFFAERAVPPTDPTPGHAAPDAFHIEGQTPLQPPDQIPLLGGLLRRSLSAGGLMILGVLATFAWRSHGHEARQILSRWAPDVVLQWLPPTAAEPSGQPIVPATEATVPAPQPASQAPGPQQPALAVPPAPETPAPSASDAALQAMARDLAKAQQTIEQLKTNQEQLAREVARLSEQEARHRASPPRPAVATARKPVPAIGIPLAAAPPRSLTPSPSPSPSPALAQTPASPQPAFVPRPPAALPAAQ